MRRRPLRVALFAPAAPHFVATLMGMRRGFEALGCEVHAGWPLPDRRMMRAFCAAFQPDLTFEINRAGAAAFGERAPCLHAAWFEALRYETRWIGDRFDGSDMVYFMLPPDLLGPRGLVNVDWRLLSPGADLEIFHPAPSPPTWDMTLCGHVYAPPPPELLAAPAVSGDRSLGTVGDLWRAAGTWPISRHLGAYDDVVNNVVEHYRDRAPELSAAGLPARSLFFIDEYIPRTAARVAVAEAMGRVSSRIRFFGNVGWLSWPGFARHYGGEIADIRRLADTFRRSAVNVHIAPWPLHFRTVDCMAAGGLVFINRTDHPARPAAFDAEFADGTHYVGYGDADDFAEKAQRWLADPQGRARAAQAAADLIARRHTWRHRAARILADLELKP